jgi:hypothetical protein
MPWVRAHASVGKKQLVPGNSAQSLFSRHPGKHTWLPAFETTHALLRPSLFIPQATEEVHASVHQSFVHVSPASHPCAAFEQGSPTPCVATGAPLPAGVPVDAIAPLDTTLPVLPVDV